MPARDTRQATCAFCLFVTVDADLVLLLAGLKSALRSAATPELTNHDVENGSGVQKPARVVLAAPGRRSCGGRVNSVLRRVSSPAQQSSDSASSLTAVTACSAQPQEVPHHKSVGSAAVVASLGSDVDADAMRGTAGGRTPHSAPVRPICLGTPKGRAVDVDDDARPRNGRRHSIGGSEGLGGSGREARRSDGRQPCRPTPEPRPERVCESSCHVCHPE